MLVILKDNIAVGSVKYNDEVSDEYIQSQHPDGIITNFNFIEDLDLYAYNGTSFELISGWEDIKVQRESEKAVNLFNTSKKEKLREIKRAFNAASNRPRVDSTLGYDVDGNKDDLYNFENALVLGVTEIRDADNVMQPATNADLELIIQKIRENGLVLYQKKWDLVAAVEAATELADLSEITW